MDLGGLAILHSPQGLAEERREGAAQRSAQSLLPVEDIGRSSRWLLHGRLGASRLSTWRRRRCGRVLPAKMFQTLSEGA